MFVRWVTAVALGAAVTLLSWYWRYSWLPPGAWEDVAVASGLRPPVTTFPLLWHALVSPLFHYMDMARAIRVLIMAGHCALGVVAMLVFAILNETLPKVLRGRIQRVGWSDRIVRVFLAQGAFLCVCSDPIWEVGQVFGPATLSLLLLLFALLIFVRYARNGRQIVAWYWTLFFLGLLAGESPLGIILIVALLILCRILAESSADKLENPMADPFIRTVTMRRMTLVAVIGWLLVILVNVLFFCWRDGLAAHDMTGGFYAVSYLFNYWKLLASAATPSGWMLFAMVVVAPLVLARVHVKVATDDDRFLPLWYAAFFFLIGMVAFLQLAGWRSFWFWTGSGEQEAVKSLLLRCVGSLMSAQTFMYAICVVGVEVYFRNYRRIAGIKFQDSVEETLAGASLTKSFRTFTRLTRFFLALEPVVLLAVVLPYRMQRTSRGIVSALHDCARQTAAECLDARYVFTDGTIDTAVELCSREQGRDVKALSLVGQSAERECYLRRRGAEDDEDRDMQSSSAMATLRTWMRLKPARLDGVALQLGFELWPRDRPFPEVAGLVARPAGFPKGMVDEAIKHAHNLVESILEVYSHDEELEDTSSDLRNLFTRMQWRVARMCRLRADILDKEHKLERSLAENAMADELDRSNASFKRVRQQMELMNYGGLHITPREGLKLGMDRADYRMAEMYARKVLYSDPDDLAANFVMGMYYFIHEQYSRAELYLKKCARLNPKAAILNNLAVAQLRQGNLEDAEMTIQRALNVDPDLAEARRTLKNIQKEMTEEDLKRRKKGLPPRYEP